MTKIDSSQNTPELMDDSVIDINTWEWADAAAAEEHWAERGFFLHLYLMYDLSLHALPSEGNAPVVLAHHFCTVVMQHKPGKSHKKG